VPPGDCYGKHKHRRTTVFKIWRRGSEEGRHGGNSQLSGLLSSCLWVGGRCGVLLHGMSTAVLYLVPLAVARSDWAGSGGRRRAVASGRWATQGSNHSWREFSERFPPRTDKRTAQKTRPSSSRGKEGDGGVSGAVSSRVVLRTALHLPDYPCRARVRVAGRMHQSKSSKRQTETSDSPPQSWYSKPHRRVLGAMHCVA
jgi:hypothetical protein